MEKRLLPRPHPAPSREGGPWSRHRKVTVSDGMRSGVSKTPAPGVRGKELDQGEPT